MSRWIWLLLLAAGCASAAPLTIPQDVCQSALVMLQNVDAVCQVRPGQNGTGTVVFDCLVRGGKQVVLIAGGSA